VSNKEKAAKNIGPAKKEQGKGTVYFYNNIGRA
jgi:hypothetical protein